MADSDRVWELMKKISICMLATWDGRELHARPMGAYVRHEENAIYFLSDASHHNEEEIARYGKVCLAFADTSGQNYVSLAGRAEVSADQNKIKELWGTPAKAWWNSPDDPRRTRQDCRLREDGHCRANRSAPGYGREPQSRYELIASSSQARGTMALQYKLCTSAGKRE
jgi:general stress protein 26